MNTINFKDVARYKSSFLVKEMKNEVVISQELIKEKKSSNEHHSLYKIDTTNYKGVFCVEAVGWGFDDVSETTYVFREKKDAESCYNYHVNFSFDNIPLCPPTTIITKEGYPNQYQPIEYHGIYAVNIKYDGDYIRPKWNSFVLDKFGWLDEIKEMASREEDDVRTMLLSKYKPALVKFGENEGGLTLTQDNNILYNTHECWETGINYYVLARQYSKDLFDLMKPLLTYHSEEIEEEGNWKGWYFTDIEAMNKILNTTDFQVIETIDSNYN